MRSGAPIIGCILFVSVHLQRVVALREILFHSLDGNSNGPCIGIFSNGHVQIELLSQVDKRHQ